MEPGGYNRNVTKMVINPLCPRVYVLESLENNSKKFLVSNLNALNLTWVHSGFFCLEEFVEAEFDLKDT